MIEIGHTGVDIARLSRPLLEALTEVVDTDAVTCALLGTHGQRGRKRGRNDPIARRAVKGRITCAGVGG